MPPQPRVEPPDDWRRIELLVWAPGQRTDELIRPAVLVGHSPADHRRYQIAPVAEKEIATEVPVESVDVLGCPGWLFLNVVCTVRVD